MSMSHIKRKVDPLCSTQKEDVLSAHSAQNFRSFSPSLSHVAIPFFFLTIEAPSKLQPLHTVSAPNRERKSFSESGSAHLRCGTSYFRLRNGDSMLWRPLIVMAAQFIHDRVEMECLEGAWETLEGNARCQFRGTIRLTATSLVHPEEPARTLQRTVEWILPTPTPYLLVEPVQVIKVTSSEEDPEELPPEPVVDALDFLGGDEDPLPEVDSPEDVMSASEADSTEESGPGGIATSGGSSS
ncbi:hypothetical protein GmHk_17G049211 [Glycine max]|nr:hypothetical protein GmHk_17G049211 [Glycine max]